MWDSTDALELKTVPERLLVMGGGIIGLEMGTVYHALGSQIDVVEMFDQVIPAADKDVVKVFTKRISKQFNLMLETKVTAVEAKEDGIYVTMEGKSAGRTTALRRGAGGDRPRAERQTAGCRQSRC